MRKPIIFLAILLAIGAIATAAYLGYNSAQPAATAAEQPPVTVAVTQGDVQRTVTAPGQLIGTHEEVLAFTVSGRITELNIRPGTIIHQGDVLAQLDSDSFEENLRRAQLQWQQAQMQYEQQLADAQLATENSAALVNSTRGQTPTLAAAQVRLDAAKAAEERAAYEYQKALDRTWEPAQVAESYKLALDEASNQRAIAQAEYDSILQQQWSVSQQVAALETETERANLTLDYLEQNGPDPFLELDVRQAEKELAAATLIAPFDGVVLDVLIRPGESVAAGQALVIVADPQAAEVRTTVIEEDLPLTQIGQTAELFFDAQPEIAVAGHVARIVPQRVEREERPLYYVYIALDDPLPDGVFAGMTVDAAIIIDQTTAALRLPRALVNPRSDGTATVEVWRNGRREERPIKTGLRGDAYLVIEEGLEAGDQVVAE